MKKNASKKYPSKLTKDLDIILQHIVEQSSDSILICDLSGTLLYANELSRVWLGLENKELDNIKVYDYEQFFNGDKLKHWEAHVQELKNVSVKEERGALVNFETSTVTRTHVRLSYLSLEQQDYILAVSKKHTEKDILEQELIQNAKLQDALLKMASKYINVDISDLTHVINNSLQEVAQFVNADRVYVFSYDFKAQTTSNTYEWCQEGIEPQINELQDVPISAIPEWVDQHRKKASFIIPDVSQLPDTGPYGVKAILEPQGVKSLIALPMFNKNELVGFIGFDSVREKHFYSKREENLLFVYAEILLNMELRQQFESELLNQKERFQNIISSIDAGLVQMDENFNITFTNHSFLKFYSYNKSSVFGKNAFNLFLKPEDWDPLMLKKNQLEKKEVLLEELLTKDSKGNFIPILASIVRYDTDETKGFLAVIIDLTNQKKLENELRDAIQKVEESMSYKEKFFANVSHELRTPLNIIGGSLSEVVKQRLSEDAHFLVNQANVASRHMLSLVNNILEFAKINEGAIKLTLKNFNLKNTLKDTFNIFELMTREKGLRYELFIDEAIHPHITGDYGKLNQILINFLGNAIKFTDQGSVTLAVKLLETTRHSQRIGFSIADTGIGMNKVFLENIFDEYAQDNSVENLKSGTGLGMTISKRLIDFMDGHVEVHSEKNKGTTVHFNLTFEKREKPVNHKIIQTNKSLLSNKVFLIAEDNYMNAVVLERKISDLGARVVTVENGQLAVEALQKQHFDLVFMDVQMPILDGFGATKAIRENLKLNIPIIAITANVFKNGIHDYLDFGFNDVILKPFEDELLYSRTLEALKPNKEDRSKKRNKKTPVHKATKKEYQLEYLKKISHGDPKFYRRMLVVFVDIMKTAIKDLNTALDSQNVDSIAKTVHKIKPSLKDLKVKTAVDLIEVIESSEYKDSDFVVTNTKALLKTLKKVHTEFSKNELTK